jgi:hypothetical protein
MCGCKDSRRAEGYVGLEAMATSILSIRRGAPSSEIDHSLCHSSTTSHPPATKQPFYPRSLEPLRTNPLCSSQRSLFSSLSFPLRLPSQWLKLKLLLKSPSALPRYSNVASDAHLTVMNAMLMYVASSLFYRFFHD